MNTTSTRVIVQAIKLISIPAEKTEEVVFPEIRANELNKTSIQCLTSFVVVSWKVQRWFF